MGAGTNSFEVIGDTNDTIFALVAVYPGNNQSQAADWYPGNGAPAPGALDAYLDGTGTNVQLSWSPATGAVTGYLVQRSDFYGYGGTYYEVGRVGPNTTWLEDTDAVDTGDFNLNSTEYEVQAMYPNGGLSGAVTSMVNTTLPAPTGLAATVDSSGTNVLLSWNAPLGGATNYNILVLRGTYSASTGTYSYTQIGDVSDNTTSFEDVGAANGNNNIIYELEATGGGGELSSPDSAPLIPPSSSIYNISVSAQLTRNQTGRWQLMFSAIPTNVTAVQVYIAPFGYDGIENAVNLSTYLGYYDLFDNQDLVDTIPVSNLTNGVFVIPDSIATNEIGDNRDGRAVGVQPIAAAGRVGKLTFAGLLSYDAPCFVDGREHLKQNLLFQLRAATVSQPIGLSMNGVWFYGDYETIPIPPITNCVESSIFHLAGMFNDDDAIPHIMLKWTTSGHSQ